MDNKSSLFQHIDSMLNWEWRDREKERERQREIWRVRFGMIYTSSKAVPNIIDIGLSL